MQVHGSCDSFALFSRMAASASSRLRVRHARQWWFSCSASRTHLLRQLLVLLMVRNAHSCARESLFANHLTCLGCTGSLLAVASRVLLNLYSLTPSELPRTSFSADTSQDVGVPSVRANLRWRTDLCAHTRALDVTSLSPGAVAPAAHGVCAVGSGMGLKLLSSSPDTQQAHPSAAPSKAMLALVCIQTEC